MPINRRIPRVRLDWSDLHRDQLHRGADAPWQKFGHDSIRCRRREGATDFALVSMPLCERAWHDLKDELLAEADCSEDAWAFNRFG